MNIGSRVQRGWNLFKVGRAAQRFRRANDEDQRRWAQHYLVELLGQSRGLPAKVGQFMTLGSGDPDLQNTLNSALQAMPFDQVGEILDRAYQKPWQQVFRDLDPEGIAASLGQVHFGHLRDGRAVAVKVQYPEIARAVEAEMDFLGWMPKVGPVAKWGFHLEGYRDAFWRNFRNELHYDHEIACQDKYREGSRPLGFVVVPEVFPEVSHPNVLVQAREDGFGLDKAETLAPSQKQAIGRVLLEHYFHMLFRHGFVHADPHPGNFAFRQTGRDRFDLILYDYGSILEVPSPVRLALLRTLLALQDYEPLDPMACLMGLGFDAQKLQDLRPHLPALLNVLFEPFVTEAPFDIRNWRLSERFDQIVGELKWWFRSAAPPSLIFLMRTLHGLCAMLERLDARLAWRFLLEKRCSDLYPEAKRLALPEVPASPASATRFDGVARYLQVHVIKSNGNKVKLTMPARVADQLEEVIDPPVKASIERQKIDLPGIQKRVRQSGFVPQTVFELVDDERQVRVWLE